ncbi:MAG: NAD(P)/FAD-dependent oxidoreductase [Gemmatimonadaceae bacterium]
MFAGAPEPIIAADVIVVGSGLIGLSAAIAVAERGVSVSLIASSRPGEASRAAAGMLAPSVERAAGRAHDFALASRDRYPSYVEFLQERTGITVPLNRLGVLQVAISEKGVRGLRKGALATSVWLTADELRGVEPALPHALGAVLNPDDGAVDNTVLLEAMVRLVSSNERIEQISGDVIDVKADHRSCIVRTKAGATHTARYVVVAAGAWAKEIFGVTHARFVEPARGQLVSYPDTPVRHVAYGPRGYIVPRAHETIGGTTMENVGYDARTTPDGILRVRAAAEEICPLLRSASPVRAWAGLRPVTPDLLPILGPHPDNDSLIYACGHSRNGVLMAPLTGDIIADLVTATPLSHDLSQFRPGRF